MELLGGFFSKFLLLLLLLNGMFSLLVQGDVHNYVFVLKETKFTRLCETKSILTVNDSFPGPTIRVHRGDTIFVNVYNLGNFGVTIHWHGVKQLRNPWSDGPEYITQCPIQAGTNFTYEVEFTEEEGTLWWHAHSDWTRATVHGAIIILPPIGQDYPFPTPYAEQVLVLACWYKSNLREMTAYAIATGLDFLASDAITINGQPGDFSACSNESTYRLVVDYGKTYLLRLVNAATNANLFFSIAGHSLTVVGTDGAYTKPIITNFIMISPGKTMDVLVKADQTPSYEYYMAARQYFSNNPDVSDFDHANATAILQYNNDGKHDPLSSSSSSPLFPSTLPAYRDHEAAITFVDRLRSLENHKYPINVPRNITTRMFVTVSMGVSECHTCVGKEGYGLSSSLNNISWMNPSIDILQAYYRNISGIYDPNFPDEPPTYFNFTSDDIPFAYGRTLKERQVKILNYGEEVEIVLQSTSVMHSVPAHPIHLHGHSFYVVGSGPGVFDNQTHPNSYNLEDPSYVNTITVPRVGWTAIRFFANNPGVWLMHCHYARHLTWGMDTVFIVKNGGTAATTMRPPPAYMPPCDAPNITPPIQLSIHPF